MIPGAADYRRRLSETWIPTSTDDPPDVAGWIAPKLDGECWIASCGPDAELMSPAGIVAPSDAPIVSELRQLPAGLVLAGELIDVADPGPAGVRRAIGSGAWGRLALAPWDVPGRDWRAALEALRSLPVGRYVAPVPWVEVAGRADIARAIRAWGSSVEGAIVRSVDGRAFKIKPKHTIDAVIIGVSADGRSVRIATVGADGAADIIGPVEAGPVDVAALRPVDGPADGWRWVAPSVVVEVAALDAAPARRPRATWTGAAWTAAPDGAALALRHPRIVQVRPDRSEAPRPVEAQLPAPAVAVRRVWVKPAIGGVRKLVIWRSPAGGWSVAWTDYAPRRADPLRRDVVSVPTREAADEVAARWISGRVRNGWREV